MTKNEFQRYDPSTLYLFDNTHIVARQTCSQEQWRQIITKHFDETKKCHFFHMPRQANLDEIINYKNAIEQRQNVDDRTLPVEYALESTSQNKAQFKSRIVHQYYVKPTDHGPQVFTKNGAGKVTKHADGGRPISDRVTPLEHSWYILTQCHEETDQDKQFKHRNRDETYAEVQKLTCAITKALVRSFIDNCPTCSGKSVTKSARAGWDTKKRRAEEPGYNSPSPEPQPKRQRKSSKSALVAPENMGAPLPYNPLYQQPEAYQQQPEGFENFLPQPEGQFIGFDEAQFTDAMSNFNMDDFYQTPAQSLEQHAQQEQYHHNNPAAMAKFSPMQQQMPFAEQMPNNSQPEINWFDNQIDPYMQQQQQNLPQASMLVDPALQNQFNHPSPGFPSFEEQFAMDGLFEFNIDGSQVDPFMQQLQEQQPDIPHASMPVYPALEEPLDNSFLDFKTLAEETKFLDEFDFSVGESPLNDDLPQAINQTSSNPSTPMVDVCLEDWLNEYNPTEVTPKFNNTTNLETTTAQQPAPQEVDMQKELEDDLYAEFYAMEHDEAEPTTTESALEEAMSADEYRELFGEDPVNTPEAQQKLDDLDMVMGKVNFAPVKPKQPQPETE